MMVLFRVIVLTMSISMLFVGCSGESTVEEKVNTALEQLQVGNIEKAEMNARKALEQIETENGLQHIDAVKPLQMLALVHQAKKETAKAADIYSRAIAIVKKTSGANSMEAAKLMNNLASLYYTEQEYEKALSVFQGSLRIVEFNYADDDPRVQKIKNNIEQCEFAMTGKSSPQAPGTTAASASMQAAGDNLPVSNVDPLNGSGVSDIQQGRAPDLVPSEIKQSTLEALARKNILLENLRPLLPVRIENKGVVLPYRCTQKMTEKDEDGIEAILLFSGIRNPDNPDAFVFQKCRMVSYDSYVEELEKNDPESLVKALKEVFPDTF